MEQDFIGVPIQEIGFLPPSCTSGIACMVSGFLGPWPSMNEIQYACDSSTKGLKGCKDCPFMQTSVDFHDSVGDTTQFVIQNGLSSDAFRLISR